jgi:hypothetical protein
VGATRDDSYRSAELVDCLQERLVLKLLFGANGQTLRGDPGGANNIPTAQMKRVCILSAIG